MSRAFWQRSGEVSRLGCGTPRQRLWRPGPARAPGPARRRRHGPAPRPRARHGAASRARRRCCAGSRAGRSSRPACRGSWRSRRLPSPPRPGPRPGRSRPPAARPAAGPGPGPPGGAGLRPPPRTRRRPAWTRLRMSAISWMPAARSSTSCGPLLDRKASSCPRFPPCMYAVAANCPSRSAAVRRRLLRRVCALLRQTSPRPCAAGAGCAPGCTSRSPSLRPSASRPDVRWMPSAGPRRRRPVPPCFRLRPWPR